MFKITDETYQRLVLPPSAAANPCDNDGVLSDSEPHIQACIFAGVVELCELEQLTAPQTELVKGTFGQPDNLMSRSLFERLSADPELGPALTATGLDQDAFVPQFVEVRRRVWENWTSSGKVEPKPFALDYLAEFRNSDRKFSMVTGMPFVIAGESIRHVLKADLFIPNNRDRRVCCDDPRLEGRGKPDPRCYQLAIDHLVAKFDIAPQDMWVIEDRANGAVSALAARCALPGSMHTGAQIGKVIVIPDEHDVTPVALWDKKGQMEAHLATAPEDRARLFFLRSLADLTFAT
ncbi:MAG: hypothetical protein K1X79_14145 [Oligoflexia bacterium]|nr:hypothetical protein [Oligoflexia bacterium]